EDSSNRQGKERAVVAWISRNLGAPEVASGNSRRWRQSQGIVRVFNSFAEDVRESGKGRILLGQRVGVDALVEDAIAAANTRLAIAENIPGKTQTRREIVHIIFCKSARQVSREENTDRRIGHCS